MTANSDYRCWHCGEPLGDEPLPLARAASCRACGRDLHVCLMCEFHDPRVANACREPIAEPVADKRRANFCGYLKLRAGAHASAARSKHEATRSDLDALFGLPACRPDAARSPVDEAAARGALDALFKQ